MKYLVALIFICAVIVSVRSQEYDGEKDEDPDAGYFSKFKEIFKKLFRSIQKTWEEFKLEFSARTEDMQQWTSEMIQSFKKAMYQWVESRPNLTADQRREMENYIARMEMPPNETDQDHRDQA